RSDTPPDLTMRTPTGQMSAPSARLKHINPADHWRSTMNLLDNLMSKFAKKDDAEPAFDPAVAKAERIKFHETQVRNGPVSFKSGTHPRRQQVIDAKSKHRKAK